MAVAPQLPEPRAPPVKQQKRGKTSYLLLLSLGVLGLLLFLSLFLLDGPASRTGAPSTVSVSAVRLRSWAAVGTQGSIGPSDSVASRLLLQAQVGSLDTLSGVEASELLLAGLLAKEGDEDGKDAIQRSAPLVRTLTAPGGSLAPPGTPHSLPSLYLLALCRHWGALGPEARRGQQGSVEDAVRHLESRVGQSGAFDSRGVGPGLHAEALGPRPLLVSTLSQVQAMAALRCAGSTLLPTLTDATGGSSAAAGLSSEALVAAERLRRGLAALHLPPEEAGQDGPYDVGSALPSSGGSTPDPALLLPNLTSPLPLAALRRVRKLTSQLPQLLLFLEDGDVPAATLAALASASLRLQTPAGLALWPAGAGAGAGTVAPGAPASAQWRVSPLEQALVTAGALKHMLPAASRGKVGLEEEEEGGDAEWAAADSLLLLLDQALRAAPPLAALEREAAERSIAMLASLQSLAGMRHLMQLGGLGGGGGGAQPAPGAAAAPGAPPPTATAIASPVLEFAGQLQALAGGALTPASLQQLQAAAASLQERPPPLALTPPQAEAFLTATAHSMTFPEFLTPLRPGDAPLAPGTAATPPLLSAVLSRLISGGAAAGRALLGRVRKVVGSSSSNSSSPLPPSPAPPSQQAPPLNSTSMLFYPPRGLQVLRHSTPNGHASALSEHVVLAVAVADDSSSSRGSGSGSGSSSDSSVYAEVLPQPQHVGALYYSAEHSMGVNSSSRGGMVVQVRGDGMALSLGTSAAAVFFRELYEDAVAWHRAVEEAEARGRPGSSSSSSSNPGAQTLPPVPEAGGSRLTRLLATSKRLAAAVGTRLVAAAVWPIERLRARGAASAAAATPISNRAMLVYLTSGAADVTLLARGYVWGAAAVIGRYRGMGGGELEAARGAQVRGVAGAAPSQKWGPLTPVVQGYAHSAEENVAAEAMGHAVGGGVEEQQEKGFIGRLQAAADMAGAGGGEEKKAAAAAAAAAAPAAPAAPAVAPPLPPPPSQAPPAVGKASAAPQLPTGAAAAAAAPPAAAAALKLPLNLSVTGKLHPAGAQAAEALGHVVEGGRSAAPASATTAPLHNVTALHARLCGSALLGLQGAPEPLWSTCCKPGSGGLGSLLGSGGGGGGGGALVEEGVLPTFACTLSEGGGGGAPEAVQVPCSWAEDDVCDCTGDGGDEYMTNACSSVQGTFFYCASGALRVEGGALTPATGTGAADANFIDAIKVHDGVRDCVEGEDEAPFAA